MLEVTKLKNDLVKVVVSGSIDKATMEKGLDELMEVSQDMQHGRMLYRINDFAMPSMGAIAVELQKMPDLLRLITRFDKAAVIANQSWIRTAANIEGMLIPGLEIETFEPDQEDEAMIWLDTWAKTA